MRQSRRARGLNNLFTVIGAVVCCVITVMVLLELGSRVALFAWRHLHRSTVADFAPGNPAYARYDWAPQCIADQSRKLKDRNLYFPFRLWGVTEFHGNCVNNDVTDLGAVRRTIATPAPACANQAKKSIWVLGGSSVYGTSIPDWATLPSYLAGEFSRANECVNVINLGVEGYATNQEILLLVEELKKGNRPDAVILYDGFNDADFGTMPPGNPTPHMGFTGIKGRLEGRFSARFDFLRGLASWQLVQELSKGAARTRTSRVPKDTLASHAVSTVDNYQQNLRIARALGGAFGFRVYAFWQPSIIFGHKPLAGYERQLLDLSSGDTYPFDALAPVYEEAERRAAKDGDFIFLGNVFDRASAPLYLDWVHLTPEGNQIVAREIAHHVMTDDQKLSKETPEQREAPRRP